MQDVKEYKTLALAPKDADIRVSKVGADTVTTYKHLGFVLEGEHGELFNTIGKIGNSNP